MCVCSCPSVGVPVCPVLGKFHAKEYEKSNEFTGLQATS